MKKVFILLMAVALVCGVVFLGIFIFNSTTVTKIEIEGEMQQIYLSGDEICFGDAKMIVTYQNGTMKKMDMNGKVTVSSFSTAGHGSYFGTMNITYKNQTLKVDYSVIDKTSYEIKDLTISGKKRIIDFKDNGICRYFEIENGKYFVRDGNKDSLYNYEIIGDKIKINLGSGDFYYLNSKIEGNSMVLISTDNKVSTREDVYTRFSTTNLIKTNNEKVEKTELSLYYKKANFDLKTMNGKTTVIIPEGENLTGSGVCLIVDYDNGEQYYVYITQSMINTNGIDEYGRYYVGAYESRSFKIYYNYENLA